MFPFIVDVKSYYPYDIYPDIVYVSIFYPFDIVTPLLKS
jgi:hypothetical protein